MLKKTMIAGAATVLLSIGALALANAPAAAGYTYGGGWSYSWHGPHYAPRHPPRPYFAPRRPPVVVQTRVCVPRYKTVRYWKSRHGWVVRKVYAGQVCSWRPVYRRW
jgi:hypothetical protein